MLRFISLILACAIAGFGVEETAQAQASPAAPRAGERQDIAPQPLEAALKALGAQSGLQIVYVSDVVEGKRSPGAPGGLPPAQALQRLLEGTGLTYKFLTDHAVAIQRKTDKASGARLDAEARPATMQLAQAEGAALPQSGEGSAPEAASSASAPARSAALEEIVVTAQKKSERLQDVPVPVTAISAQALVDSNLVRLQDYYTSVPGFNVVPPSAQSSTVLAIRGITTGGGSNPTVGITVDDVPYGASIGLGGGTVVPDIDPADLARVEVLRGPQGTLYGASSMGGLLKFVTVDPSTDGWSGRVEAGADGVYHGTQPGYAVRGSVNIPVTDVFAMRASGFFRQDAGYIDNPVLGIDGLNRAEVWGARLSALWRPADTFSLKLSALYQDSNSDGSNDVDRPTAGYAQTTGLGDLQQNYLRGIGGSHRKVEAFSAITNAKLGAADLVSVTGYNINSYKDSFDYTYALGTITKSLYHVSGTPLFDDNKTNKFTQEVRVSLPLGSRVDWLLGGFYTHESSTYVENIAAEDPNTQAIVANGLLFDSFPTRYEEYAAFTDFTLHFTDSFDVQLGARESEIRQAFTQTQTGVYASPPPFIPQSDTSANAFTYLVTPRLKLAPNWMVYARLASGYRAGGANGTPGGVVPTEYRPDRTQNYELGTKADFFDRVLSVDASLYYIDWRDIQIQLLNPATNRSYNTNGSRAKSEGAELSLTVRPATGLTIGGWAAWDDAVLTQAFPARSTVYGVSGDRLPYSSRFSGNLSVEQTFPVGARLEGSVGAVLSYVGDREGIFRGKASSGAPLLRQDYPAYARTDLHTGLKYDEWNANLYVNNVADRRGVLEGGLGGFPPFGFIYIQPRTVGLAVTRTF